MSTRGISTRSRGGSPKRPPSVASLPFSPSKKSGATELPRLETSKLPPSNGDAVFDAKAFLAIAGLGRKVVNLKKNGVAYAQGDSADAIYYVQKGRLRVTVTSANGKEATITLVGPGEFLGENCMVSAHPVRLATATAMTARPLPVRR